MSHPELVIHASRHDPHLDDRRYGVEYHRAQHERYALVAPLDDPPQHTGVAFEVILNVEAVNVIEGGPSHAPYRRLGNVGEDGVADLVEEGGEGAGRAVRQDEEGGEGRHAQRGGGEEESVDERFGRGRREGGGDGFAPQRVDEGLENERRGDGDTLPREHERHRRDDPPPRLRRTSAIVSFPATIIVDHGGGGGKRRPDVAR